MLSAHSKEVVHLESKLAEATRRRDTECKEIPGSPDIAGLISQLSVEVDGRRVRDQRFTAGQPAAVGGRQTALQTTPLTVDMEATFDSVFDLVGRVESMARLVRVKSIRVVCQREAETDDQPLVKATMDLAVVHQADSAREAD